MATVPGTQPLLPESAQQVVRRFTFGYNSRLAAQVLRHRDVYAWLEDQFQVNPDPDANATLNWFPRLGDSPATAWSMAQSGKYGGWQYGNDFAMYSVARRVAATNQVHEMMVDFWSNLLHIPVGEDSSFPWRLDYDAKAIRPNALTSYKQLLNAAVVHPAMSGFLTNYRNTAQKINENLGRELLELYTVGRPDPKAAQPHYSEDDVKNSARLLTGFTVKVFDGFAAGYDPKLHYVGPVTIMGQTFTNSAADGRAELTRYLNWLAVHPRTAKRIAARLCARFVSDDAPQSVIDAVAQTYLDSDTDIKSCLRTLIAHPAFKASAMQKARTPIEDVIAAERACDITHTGAGSDSRVENIAWFCSWTGQAPFSWPRPDGFPEKSDTYLSPARMLRSWTHHTWTAGPNGQLKQAERPTSRELSPPVWPLPLADLIHHQAVMMTGRRATDDVVSAVATLVDKKISHVFKYDWEKKNDHMAWMLTLIRTAILNAPEAMLR
ncbi:MAG TPA: DUF1800 domain-containing protein [Aeromicrobium sp.]|nr:DUF1800 domain-containing protein [Aeromicrobium sp.]